MLRTHTIHWGHELLKSMLVTFVIILLSLALASVAAEDRVASPRPAESPRTPQLLPANIQSWAQPLQDSSVGPTAYVESSDEDPLSTTMKAWQAIQARRDGDLIGSLKAWREIQLPAENETWRLTMLAEVQMIRGNWSDAETLANDAIAIAPNNALAHYLLGRVSLARVIETPPKIELDQPPVIWVGYSGDQDAVRSPNWESHAIRHFADALLAASATDPSHPLMGGPVVLPRPGDMAMPVVSPTVGDLMTATNTERFKAESHNYLGKLFMKRGFYAAAEEQFDSAAQLDTWVVNDYIRLSQHFLDNEDQASAQRVAYKAGHCVWGRLLTIDHELRGMLAEW